MIVGKPKKPVNFKRGRFKVEGLLKDYSVYSYTFLTKYYIVCMSDNT